MSNLGFEEGGFKVCKRQPLGLGHASPPSPSTPEKFFKVDALRHDFQHSEGALLMLIARSVPLSEHIASYVLVSPHKVHCWVGSGHDTIDIHEYLSTRMFK